MERFYCNGKKGFCIQTKDNRRRYCGDCKHYDGSGGEYLQIEKNNFFKRLKQLFKNTRRK